MGLSTTLAVMYGLVGIGLLASLRKDRQKTLQVLRAAARILLRLAPSILVVVGVVGLIMGLLSPETITRYIGPGTGFYGTLVAALVGAVALIPALVSFPLAASLLELGAAVTTVVAFITTLTMVGFVTAPLEARLLGIRFTVWRNTLSLAGALLIAFVMGAVLS